MVRRSGTHESAWRSWACDEPVHGSDGWGAFPVRRGRALYIMGGACSLGTPLPKTTRPSQTPPFQPPPPPPKGASGQTVGWDTWHHNRGVAPPPPLLLLLLLLLLLFLFCFFCPLLLSHTIFNPF